MSPYHPSKMSAAENSKNQTNKPKPKLDQRVLSLERDSSLGCLLVKGAAVPKREPGEKLFTKFASLIKTHFSITIMQNDINRCWRLTSKQRSPIVVKYVYFIVLYLFSIFIILYFRFNSSHEQSVFYRLTDPKLRPRMKEVNLFLSKLQSSFDSCLKSICDLLLKHGLLTASFINKDSLTCVKLSKESDVILITSKHQLRTIFEDHEKFYLADDIISERITQPPPKPLQMEH